MKKLIFLVSPFSFFILFCNFYNFNAKNEVLIEIKQTQTLNSIAEKLKKENLIKSEFCFLYSAKTLYKLGCFNKFEKGEYLIQKNETLLSFLKKIEIGDIILHSVTFPEGITNFEFIEILNNNKMLSGKLLKHEKELILMPETYKFAKETNRSEILNIAEKNMSNFLKEIWNKLPDERKKLLKNKIGLYILASIVEKEVALKEEAPLVASVYLNRLKVNMKLQADPTVVYGITDGKYNIGRRLTFTDLKIKNPYNTYSNYGLPLHAIGVPSKNSILGILNAKDTDFLFFVKKVNEPGHIFTKEFKDHLKNANQYRENKQNIINKESNG